VVSGIRMRLVDEGKVYERLRMWSLEWKGGEKSQVNAQLRIWSLKWRGDENRKAMCD
jgi:hypothetical protein